MSLVVLLDTATEFVIVGIAEVDAETGTGRLLANEALAVPRQANALLLPALARLLDRTAARRRGIAAVVAGRGPGSFTGVRIGMATAKGLAHGWSVPLVGVPTLDAVAWNAAERTGVVGVVGDAMRSEVYPARYAADGTSVARLDAAFTVAPPAEVAERWASEAGGPIVLTGNGLAKYADVFAAALGENALLLPEASWHPTAAGLLAAAAGDLAAALADASGFEPAVALPIYTRLSDAEEAETVRRSTKGGAPPHSGVAGPSGTGAS